MPQTISAINTIKRIILPELKGNPIVFTKKSSKLPANLMVIGIMKYIIKERTMSETNPAKINPFISVFLNFLK